MNSTKNYHLNQWEATDRVLRQDFNADNVKIDAALTSLAGGGGSIRKLKTITVDETITGTDVFDMDVSDLDWGAWQVVYADFALLGSGYMLLYPNGNANEANSRGYVTSNNYKSLSGMIGCNNDDHKDAITRVEFQIYGSGAQIIKTISPYRCLTGEASNIAYDQLISLHLTPSNASYVMKPNGTITFYGVR